MIVYYFALYQVIISTHSELSYFLTPLSQIMSNKCQPSHLIFFSLQLPPSYHTIWPHYPSQVSKSLKYRYITLISPPRSHQALCSSTSPSRTVTLHSDQRISPPSTCSMSSIHSA